MTDSAWNVALIGFFRTAAMPVLGIMGGAIADRYDRRHLLIAVQGLNLSVTVLVALMMATNLLPVWMIYAAAVVMGIGVSGFATNQSTIILANVPEDMRGRAMGVLTAAIGTMPFGALLIGALASATSAPLAVIIIAGLCTTLVALITLFSPRLRAH